MEYRTRGYCTVYPYPHTQRGRIARARAKSIFALVYLLVCCTLRVAAWRGGCFALLFVFFLGYHYGCQSNCDPFIPQHLLPSRSDSLWSVVVTPVMIHTVPTRKVRWRKREMNEASALCALVISSPCGTGNTTSTLPFQPKRS